MHCIVLRIQLYEIEHLPKNQVCASNCGRNLKFCDSRKDLVSKQTQYRATVSGTNNLKPALNLSSKRTSINFLFIFLSSNKSSLLVKICFLVNN